MREAFRKAVENITTYGDTDVFPFPLENHMFFDRRDDVVELLLNIHQNVNGALQSYPPLTESMLTAVGYNGFRWATQIDPLWNAYFLGLVISIGDRIEAARLDASKETVFSYRFKWDETEKTIFDKAYGWVGFQKKSVEKARVRKYVLACDISDFYPRIYHHRLDNALRKATGNSYVCQHIMDLLMQFSKGVSYGLPVGGPAARLLSELLLNRVDRLLFSSGIEFCRFADDYHIFADSAEDAYRILVFVSEKLLDNEGMLLQKAKTRVMSSGEFLGTSEFAVENEPETTEEAEGRAFLRLRLHYDPYSQTAVEDYESLKEQLSHFDVIGMLAREMRKSRIHQTLAKKLVSSVKHLDDPQRDAALVSLVENLPTLYPIFPSIMLVVKSLIALIAPATRELAFARVRELLRSGSHIALVPTHLAYAVRLLAHDNSDETDEILSRVYRETNNTAIRRDIILAMARRNADYWVSDVTKSFATVTHWERGALIVASFILADEGRHWRKSLKGSLTPLQALTKEWAATKFNGKMWEIPV
jgi:hypothetical protein